MLDQSPSGLLLDIKEYDLVLTPYIWPYKYESKATIVITYSHDDNLWIAAAWSAFSYYSKVCPNLGPDILTT